MPRIHIHLECIVHHGSPHHVKIRHRTQGHRPETGTRLQIKRLTRRRPLNRLHVSNIRLELICAFVRIFEHRIIEIQIEPEHRIRHSHLDGRFMHLYELALVSLVHLNGRIEILSDRHRRDRHGKSRSEYVYRYVSFHDSPCFTVYSSVQRAWRDAPPHCSSHRHQHSAARNRP